MINNEDTYPGITILLGAGSSLDVYPELSTEAITNAILEGEIHENYEFDVSVMRQFIKTMIESMKEYGCESINFETIFQFILDVYTTVSQKEKRIPPFEIPKLKQYSEKRKEELCKEAMYFILSQIRNHIRYIIPGRMGWKKDGATPNDTYTNLFNMLRKEHILNIFTLNYDSSLDPIFKDANDGFVKDSDDSNIPLHFNPKRAIEINEETYNHLHGSINFSRKRLPDNEDSIMFKYNPATFSLYKEISLIDLQNNNITTYLPFITGTDKMNSLMHDPFRTYHTNSDLALKKNKVLIVVGYSYGDIYINAMIASFLMTPGNTLINVSRSEKKWIKDFKEKCKNKNPRIIQISKGFLEIAKDSKQLEEEIKESI